MAACEAPDAVHASAASRGACAAVTGPRMPGARKWLGGAWGADGTTLCAVPANASYVLKIDSTTGTISRLEAPLPATGARFKYLRGERAPDGRVFCIPACAQFVLVIDETTQRTTQLPLPAQAALHSSGEWQWHGAQLGLDGCIYAVPANAPRVLKIDPATDECTLIGPELELGVRCKWYGGLRAADGCIWAIPYNASRLLRITPASGAVELVGPDFGVGGWKWHGGVRTGRYILGMPSHAERVLRVNTEDGVVDLIGAPVAGKYKWGGACVDAQGVAWGIPSDTDVVIRIDAERGETRLLGPQVALGEVSDSRAGERRVSNWRNKWQGAVLGLDGLIYAIPCDADHVLVIHPRTEQLELLGTLPAGRKKWQGGYRAPDGGIWGLPESADCVLRIRASSTTTAAVVV